MKSKLGQGLAVGLTALASSIVAIAGMVLTREIEVCTVMVVPVVVAFVIMLGDGWD